MATQPEPNPYESPAAQPGHSTADGQSPALPAQKTSRGSMSRVLPSRCPNCGQKFRVMLPMPRTQMKVALVLCGGAVLTVAWIAGIIAFYVFSPVVVIPLNGAALALGGTIMVVPLIVAFGWARRIPRVATLKCEKCKWSKSWFVEP